MNKPIVSNYQPPARPSDGLTTTVFEGDQLHTQEKDQMSLTRISNQVALSLSELISWEEKELTSYQILTSSNITIDQCKAIAQWSKWSNEPLYLLFGSRWGNVVAREISVQDITKFTIEVGLYLNSGTAFMLARKNPKDFGALTAMDLLSTESMSRESIGAFVDRLLDPKHLSGKSKDIFDPKWKGNSMSKKAIAEGQIWLINLTYQYAILFIQLLGIHLHENQLQRRFRTVDEFKEHIYRIKPELNELNKNDSSCVFQRKNGVGMIVECAIIRAMDHVYDTLLSDRYRGLDKESELILKKIKSIRGVHITNEDETGFDIRYDSPTGYFEGYVYLRKKHFFKVILKMAYNRKYGEAEALKDLLGMRYETLNPRPENIANAIAFFQNKIFNANAFYRQKWALLSLDVIRERGIRLLQDGPWKNATNRDLKNGDITGTVSYKENGSPMVTTGMIEMQFQYVGGMENGFNKTEVYELKKFLSAAARILKGFDIKNLKFFIKIFLAEINLSEQSILNHLFFPTEGWRKSMSPESEIEEPEKESDSELWIAKYWDSSHGFILPLKSKKWGVRFTTRDVITPSYFDLYNKSYLQPASVRFDYLLKMYERADVQKEVEAFKKMQLLTELEDRLKEH